MALFLCPMSQFANANGTISPQHVTLNTSNYLGIAINEGTATPVYSLNFTCIFGSEIFNNGEIVFFRRFEHPDIGMDEISRNAFDRIIQFSSESMRRGQVYQVNFFSGNVPTEGVLGFAARYRCVSDSGEVTPFATVDVLCECAIRYAYTYMHTYIHTCIHTVHACMHTYICLENSNYYMYVYNSLIVIYLYIENIGVIPHSTLVIKASSLPHLLPPTYPTSYLLPTPPPTSYLPHLLPPTYPTSYLLTTPPPTSYLPCLLPSTYPTSYLPHLLPPTYPTSYLPHLLPPTYPTSYLLPTPPHTFYLPHLLPPTYPTSYTSYLPHLLYLLPTPPPTSYLPHLLPPTNPASYLLPTPPPTSYLPHLPYLLPTPPPTYPTSYLLPTPPPTYPTSYLLPTPPPTFYLPHLLYILPTQTS